ncbi:MAG: DUF3857 domain-containing protein, partial [Rufibacter sp.]
MKRVCGGLLLVLGLIFQVMAAGKPVATGSEPVWVLKTQFRDKAKPAGAKNNASDGYLYLLKDAQEHVGEKTRYYHYSRKIVTDAGLQYGSEIGVQYDPDYEKLVFHRIVIHRDGQVLNRLVPKEFKVVQQEKDRERFIYDNSLTALISLTDVRVGDVIDYSFSVIGENPIHPKYAGYFGLSGAEETDQVLVRVLTPANRPLRYKLYNTAQKIQEIRQPNLIEYRWAGNQVPGRSPEDHLPSWYSPYGYVWFTEYTSWEQVNEWAQRLYALPAVKNAKLQEKIEEIKENDGSDEGRITAAVKFVQNEVRYLGNEGGIYGYQPQDPGVVFTRRYGDCKDKALLLCYMLEQMNISAFPVLVNTEVRQELAKELPSPYAFNHCVVKVQLLGKALFYDATISHQGGDHETIYFPNYALGLVIKPGTRALEKLPVTANAKIETFEEYFMGRVEDEVLYNVRTSLHGIEADQARDYFASTSQAEIEKNYLNFYASYFPAIKTENELLINDLPESNDFTIYENYRIPEFWQQTENSSETVWKAEFYPFSLLTKLVVPTTKLRTMPLALDFPTNQVHTIKIHLPSHYNVDESETEYKDKSIYFKQTITYDRTEQVVRIDYEYRTLKPFVAGEDMKSYLATVKKIKDETGFFLTDAQPATAAEGTGSGGINWLALGLVGISLVIGGFGAYRLYLYDPAPVVTYLRTPLAFGGWLVLPMIGIVLSCPIILVDVFNQDLLSSFAWERLGNPESFFYKPGMLWWVGLSIVYNGLLFCFAVLIAVLFFQKRSSLPRVISIFYAVTLVGTLSDVAVASAYDVDISGSVREVVRAIVAAAIWIPYFNKSTRVQET